MSIEIKINGQDMILTEEQAKKIEAICSEDSFLIRKNIADLNNKTFYIRDYQRGYRWTSVEVEALLKDIDEIEEACNGYCMQPIVVKKIQKENAEVFELLDGQQRLTTIKFLIDFLNKKVKDLGLDYQIEYEIDRKLLESNKEIKRPEIYYRENAQKCIEEWFSNRLKRIQRNRREKDDFLKNYCNKLKKVFFIWYEMKDNTNTLAEDVFNNINKSKIALTNAELFKALLLNPDNIDPNNKEAFIAQQQIAFEWDKMESELNDEDFWYFLSKENLGNGQDFLLELSNNPEKVYLRSNQVENQNTRIDYIIELYARCEKKKNEKRFPFDKDKDRFPFLVISQIIQEALQSNPTGLNKEIVEIWKSIVSIYDKLHSWYKDFELYHTIGFLAAISNKSGSQSVVGDDIFDIYYENHNASLKDTKKYVREKIAKKLITKIVEDALPKKNGDKDLDIGYDDAITRNILLFSNIYCMGIFNEKVDSKNDECQRFPFKIYNTENWDIEHVLPHKVNEKLKDDNELVENIKMLQKELKNNIEIQEGASIFGEFSLSEVQSILEKFVNGESSWKDQVKDFWEKYANHINESPQNLIKNLVLLNYSINRGYGNDFFTDKRNKIIEQDKKGVFIPCCTKNVFLEYYSEKPDGWWDDDDMNEYQNTLIQMLKELSKYKKESK